MLRFLKEDATGKFANYPEMKEAAAQVRRYLMMGDKAMPESKPVLPATPGMSGMQRALHDVAQKLKGDSSPASAFPTKGPSTPPPGAPSGSVTKSSMSPISSPVTPTTSG